MKLFVEGGGDGKDQRSRAREGFRNFLEKAGMQGRMPRIVASGSRNDAFSDFVIEYSRSRNAMLLVDSEDPVSGQSPWLHLQQRDRWPPPPPGATDDDCHLMVQCMESWILADPHAVEAYFGNGFLAVKLPKRPIETIHRKDAADALDSASQGTAKRGYRKGDHSFALLARIDPEKVRAASPWADRFLATLSKRLNTAQT